MPDPFFFPEGASQCSEAGDCHFGDPAREAGLALDGTVVAPLSQLALIRATGADVDTFLQGQLSSDLRQLSTDRAQISSFNSAKGRMLAVLHLVRAPTAVLMELPRALLDPVLKKLSMYVLRSKVKLEAAPDLALFGIAGPEARAIAKALGLPLPESALDCAWSRDRAIVRRLGAPARYSIVVPSARAAETWEELKEHAPPVGTQAWKLLDIEAGIPAVYPETQDRFVAQMCNLDALGGVSFDKGCYTGQEVVARVHYRGTVKRHMGKVITLTSGLPPGSAFALPDGRSGEIVDSAPHPNGGTAALVVATEP